MIVARQTIVSREIAGRVAPAIPADHSALPQPTLDVAIRAKVLAALARRRASA